MFIGEQVRRVKIAQDHQKKHAQKTNPSHKQVTETHPHPAHTLHENQNAPGSEHRTNRITQPVSLKSQGSKTSSVHNDWGEITSKWVNHNVLSLVPRLLVMEL